MNLLKIIATVVVTNIIMNIVEIYFQRKHSNKLQDLLDKSVKEYENFLTYLKDEDEKLSGNVTIR